eukprot:GEMP01092471.1.p1 GENE.GEMP01092471.1~~GEMP01092471.1.p1  ORF type:complete len:214 (+),score=34.94 GEMP01092471.1:172-813(+)
MFYCLQQVVDRVSCCCSQVAADDDTNALSVQESSGQKVGLKFEINVNREPSANVLPAPNIPGKNMLIESQVAQPTATGSQEKEIEKQRLQGLVKIFAGEAVHGMDVNVARQPVKPPARATKMILKMDRHLSTFTLAPRDEALAGDNVPIQRTVDLKSVTSITQCEDAAQDVDSVCVRTHREAFYFYFDSSHEQRRFFTCLRILRMSAVITTHS